MSVPALRFRDELGRDFADWIERELQEVAEINPKTGLLPNEFVYIDLESVEKGILLKETVISKDEAPSRAQRLLNKEDILFQTVRPYQGNNLFFHESGDYVASTGYAQIRTSENSRFLYQYLHLEDFTAEVMNRCTGTSYPAINSSGLATILINLPTKPEQTKIANFLTAVDEKITQLTQKHDLLTQYKKGVMQHIFNQELRFKDEDGKDFPEWEETTLGEIGKFKSGTGFPDSEQGGTLGIPFYKVSDMNIAENKLEMLVANNYVSEDQINKMKYKVISDEAIVFAKVGAAIFLERKRKAKNFLIDNNMMAFIPTCQINFIKHFMDSIRLSKFAQVGALPSYNATDLSIIEIALPCIKEQSKIANFLTALDDKITTTQTQLQAVKQYKQGLLQQMFV